MYSIIEIIQGMNKRRNHKLIKWNVARNDFRYDTYLIDIIIIKNLKKNVMVYYNYFVLKSKFYKLMNKSKINLVGNM